MTSTAGIYLPLAKKKGIPVTIAHARSAGVDPGVKGVLTRLMRRGLAGKADYLFMCSEPAGCSVFGRRAVEQGRTIFIPNAIETGDFAYNEEIRKRIRRELSLEDSYVIGHVGRFHYAKNHEYLLQIFAQLCTLKKEKKFVLLLLGEGERMDAMRTLARELGVEKQVIFAGNKRNVSDYYQAMDYFVYPSRFEGLPGTMVEAQASGLRCLMSDTICAEVILTDLVKVMSIEQAPEQWAQCLADTMDYKRVSCDGQIAGAGFDVAKQAKRMMVFYETGQWKYEEGQTD